VYKSFEVPCSAFVVRLWSVPGSFGYFILQRKLIYLLFRP